MYGRVKPRKGEMEMETENAMGHVMLIVFVLKRATTGGLKL